MLELIVNKNKDTENIILVENGKVVESYISNKEDRKLRLEGNIYIGEIEEVIDGMQAAFVEFGGEKKGFIHLKDTIPQVDETKQNIDKNLDIKNIIKPKQKLLIQIKKDSDNKKGARVSTHISLPGKYIVLMPDTTFVTISQKIENNEKREKLIKKVQEKLPEGFGAVVRTSSENASDDEIKQDIECLINKWNKIQENYKKAPKKPCLIWESENVIEKMITDLSTKKLELITTNCEQELEKLSKILKDQNSNINLKLEKNNNLLEKYDINKQLEKIENRKIWLNCGGFITIDSTEALTAIDVNTGKFTGKKDLEATVFKVNKEATLEIAKQLRLRDIGGIIIIDYIDMQSSENKQKILELLKQELKQDRAKTQVEGFTKLNLMELTRKHICSHLTK